MTFEEIHSLLRESMKIKPVSNRGAHQKTSTPKGMTRMNYNENPYGMAPSVRKALEDSVKDGYMYQDFYAVDLRKQLADFYGLTMDHVCIGAGSSSIIDMIGEVFLNYGDEVVYCMPSYDAFADMVSDNGGIRVEVPLDKNYCYDLNGMAAAITPKTKLAIIVNPNNPTGTYVKAKEVEKFIRSLPSHVIAVIDEAYFDYVDDPEHYSMIKLVQDGYDKPVIVLRTFSKIYGLAGMRVGYGIADPIVVDQLMKASQAWNVSRNGILAAQVALKDQDYVRKMREKNVESRNYLIAGLKKLGCDIAETQSNFIFFDPHEDAKEIKERLQKEYHILVGAPHEHIRVTVGTDEQNDLFLSAMNELLDSEAVDRSCAV